ncbi:MAG: hypothetical protein O3C43_05025 [Verrucomicrobia bacterium]|nr:hypothetical protein [Verrucomicrobiota bacterium]
MNIDPIHGSHSWLCGKEMISMGYKFRAPNKSDVNEWKRIEDGIENGTEWEIRTIRKEVKKEKPKNSPEMKKALGITK